MLKELSIFSRMNLILFDCHKNRENLLPLTFTRPIADIRIGILTIREKWERLLGLPSFDKKEDDYKDLDRSINIHEAVEEGDCFIIHGNILPTTKLIKAINQLKNGEFIAVKRGAGIVFKVSKNEIKEGSISLILLRRLILLTRL